MKLLKISGYLGRLSKKLALVFFISFMVITPSRAFAAAKAFPTAEGFGTEVTTGGRGGRVIKVTNLADSGSGSLRACIEATGPRVCIFTTGGTIVTTTPLIIESESITIAGQTAPGGGIAIRNAPNNSDPTLKVSARNVIIQNIKIYSDPGTDKTHSLDTLQIAHNDTGVRNVVIDHVTAAFGVDETFNTWYDTRDVTIQWSMIAYGLNCSSHEKGCHSKGALLGSRGGNISFHHNLLAHNNERNPRVNTKKDLPVDIVNNVLYNYGWGLSSSDQYNNVSQFNAVKNYFKAGPNTSQNRWEVTPDDDGAAAGPGFLIYLEGNIGPHRPNDNLPEENLAYFRDRQGENNRYEQLIPTHKYRTMTRLPAPAITESTAQEAYTEVLRVAGARQMLRCDGSLVLRQDSLEARIVADVQQGTGNWINHPSEVGYPSLAAGSPCEDSDDDGMPDEFENKFGLNSSVDDASADSDNDGYTNLEEYLHGTGILQPNDPPETKIGDIAPLNNPDGKVDISDYSLLLQVFGQAGEIGFHPADIRQNGIVDIFDYSALIENFGT